MEGEGFCDIKCPVCGCRSFGYTRIVSFSSELNAKVEVNEAGKPVVDEYTLQPEGSVMVTCMYCGTQMPHIESILDKKQNNEFNLE